MNFFTMNFNGDPNLGMYGFATNKYALIGSGVYKKKIEDKFKIKVIGTTISGTDLVGLFSAGNSDKIVVPEIIEERELNFLKEKFSVYVLESRYTALGNLILLNDKGCVLSPLLERHKIELENFFGFKCHVSTVAGLDIVGSAAMCNNNSCIVHPSSTEDEMKIIQKALGVKVGIGTANFGSPFIGACLMGNDNFIAVSEQTTGPELSMIDEAFSNI